MSPLLNMFLTVFGLVCMLKDLIYDMDGRLNVCCECRFQSLYRDRMFKLLIKVSMLFVWNSR